MGYDLFVIRKSELETVGIDYDDMIEHLQHRFRSIFQKDAIVRFSNNRNLIGIIFPEGKGPSLKTLANSIFEMYPSAKNQEIEIRVMPQKDYDEFFS